jgi:hypothetical protein
MSREAEMEKVFNQRLDDLLARKGVQLDKIGDSDLRSSLGFARKMGALCAKPSPEYKTRLKARLMQKIAAEEAGKASRRNWLSRLIPQQPMMRLATALVLIVLVSTAVWATGVFNHGTGIAPVSPLTVSASTNKVSYSQGESVRINVSLKNLTSENLKIEQYPPILSLMDATTRQSVYTFKAGSGTDVLAPSETAIFTLTWDQKNDDGINVSSGRYYIELEDLYYQGHTVKLTLDQPVSFNILPAS